MTNRLFFPATQKNNTFIGDVISKFIPKTGSILEIGSGSGEHGVIFQRRFPSLKWQTSDPEISHRESISDWIEHYGLKSSMPQPIDLDITKRPWKLNPSLITDLKAVICINVLHVSPLICINILFEESSHLLKKGQILMIYGPFKKNGNHISESNASFDKYLKIQNKTWGIRDLDEITKLSAINGFKDKSIIQMPANNLSIIYEKYSD
tara:strand:- start:1578 stop:2201 length:624 start_codon:yes stop_codon:yes gene_type:complete